MAVDMEAVILELVSALPPGKSASSEEVARAAGTIPYVLTCAVSQRVPRVLR